MKSNKLAYNVDKYHDTVLTCDNIVLCHAVNTSD